uniref:MFS domain-containing protein n=1 Tax=Macrostomum lignano TaxID=282301 RepID=A0A1I8IMZ3_9PLAT
MSESSKGGGLTIDAAVEQIGFGRFQIGLVAVCGTVQAADAMEMVLLSFLGRSVQCQWHLSSQQIAWLATCVFIGTMIGAPILGAISDRYGRWNALLLSACLIALLRSSVSRVAQSALDSHSPRLRRVRHRRPHPADVDPHRRVLIAWLSLGSDGTLKPNGWRFMLAGTSVPLFLILPMFFWLPRSPRFLLASGRPEEALTQLNRAARSNKRPELTGPLSNTAARGERASLKGLFANPTMTRLTLLSIVNWIGGGFLYYGLVLLSTELPGQPHRCLQNLHQMSAASSDKSSTECCQALSSEDYATAAFATLGEFFGYLIIILFIDTCGRRAVIASNTGVLSVLLVCMLFCMPPKLLAVLLFFARSCAASAFTAIYIFTNEAYPTTIRTLGMGVCCAASRIGALLSPFVAQVMLPDYSVMAAMLTYAGMAVVTTVCVLLMPFDTKGRSLMQTVEEVAEAASAGQPSSKPAGEPTEGDGLRMTGDPKKYSSVTGGLTVDAAVEKIGFGWFQVGLVAVCGTVQAADAMEMVLLSFLGRSVQCQWHLSSQQIAWLATCVFIGTIIGAPILGAISDRYGRWNALLLSACLIAYYGAVSAASPSLPWILTLRGFVGFAIGGLIPLTSTLTGEFLTAKFRATFITLGGLLEVLIAWLFLGSDGALIHDGWRRVLAATSIPLFLSLPMFLWLPRSPRFLLASGRPEEALAELNRVARCNKSQELTGPLTDVAAKKSRADLRGLFANRTLTRLTLLLLVFWFCGGFMYYGMVLLTTELPGLPHRCLQDLSLYSNASAGKSTVGCCQALRNADYATAAFATLGEFFGYLIIILFIDVCGRRAVMAVNSCVTCVLFVSMLFCMPQKLLTALLFFCRGCSQAAFITVFVYTNEAYPTTIRTLGMGVCFAASRIGALLTPFVAQVLLPDYSMMAGLFTYAAVALLAAVVAVLLPFETKGRPLFQTVEEIEGSAVKAEARGAAAASEDDGLMMDDPNVTETDERLKLDLCKSIEDGLTMDAAIEKIGFGRFQIGLVAVCGTVQAADSMEMILLSFLGRSVQCQWHLASQQIALLATCVFIGTIFGAPILGAISDRYGRWNALLLSACLIAYYGALSAASPNLTWLLTLRGFVGFAIGGLIPLTSTLTGEFLPTKYRALFLIVMMTFWTFGGLLEVFIAWLLLGSDGVLIPDGWRRVLAATSIPLFAILPLFFWLPRSPRFLLASGRPEEALVQLNRAARCNGSPELTGPLAYSATKTGRADFNSLFANRTLIRLTSLLLLFWFCGGFLYYGLVLLTTELPGLPHRCLQSPGLMSKVTAGKSSSECCQALRSADYETAALATLGSSSAT